MMVCLDADCVIYFVERNPDWGPTLTARIAAVRAAGDSIAASDLVRTECLTGPLAKGDTALVSDYQTFFADPTLKMLPLTSAVCERAARIRAASNFNLKVPDCLHLAAAIEHGCSRFITNDSQLKQCPDIAVEVLSDP